MNDPISHPSHYTQGGMETIDYLKAKLTPEQLKGFCIGNVIKYLSRAEEKNGLEDLKKAQWYLNYIITRELTRPIAEAVHTPSSHPFSHTNHE